MLYKINKSGWFSKLHHYSIAPPKLLKSSKNTGIKGSDILASQEKNEKAKNLKQP